MLTSYFLFVFLNSLVTLSRRSTPGLYKRTLQAFQFLVMIISCLAVAQFFAQFVVDGRQLIMFYGIVPDFLFGIFNSGGQNTIHPLFYGSSILKSNGIFLVEPSTLSQITSFGILIEVLEFGRPRYLFIMALGFLTAYSGTGLMSFLLLPVAGLRSARASFSALLVVMFALGLFATGVIDVSVFLDRAGEFQDVHGSGFGRFVAPVWRAAEEFDSASWLALLVGNGPGSVRNFQGAAWYSAWAPTWFKMFIEFGIIGSFVFYCFLASCLKRSKCPGPVLAALILSYMFNAGYLTTFFLTMMIVLCTLHGSALRRDGIDEKSPYLPFAAAGSGAG
jgi:hypothetical protein